MKSVVHPERALHDAVSSDSQVRFTPLVRATGDVCFLRRVQIAQPHAQRTLRAAEDFLGAPMIERRRREFLKTYSFGSARNSMTCFRASTFRAVRTTGAAA